FLQHFVAWQVVRDYDLLNMKEEIGILVPRVHSKCPHFLSVELCQAALIHVWALKESQEGPDAPLAASAEEAMSSVRRRRMRERATAREAYNVEMAHAIG
ncbi:unnamed protein product, partial [Amoebophrya sp. A25]